MIIIIMTSSAGKRCAVVTAVRFTTICFVFPSFSVRSPSRWRTAKKTKRNNRAHAHTHNVARARVERVGRTGYWSRTSHEQQQASLWRRRRRRCSYFLFRDHNDCVVYNNNYIRSRRCVCVCLPGAASAAVAVEEEWLGRAACGVVYSVASAV